MNTQSARFLIFCSVFIKFWNESRSAPCLCPLNHQSQNYMTSTSFQIINELIKKCGPKCESLLEKRLAALAPRLATLQGPSEELEATTFLPNLDLEITSTTVTPKKKAITSMMDTVFHILNELLNKCGQNCEFLLENRLTTLAPRTTTLLDSYEESDETFSPELTISLTTDTPVVTENKESADVLETSPSIEKQTTSLTTFPTTMTTELPTSLAASTTPVIVTPTSQSTTTETSVTTDSNLTTTESSFELTDDDASSTTAGSTTDIIFTSKTTTPVETSTTEMIDTTTVNNTSITTENSYNLVNETAADNLIDETTAANLVVQTTTSNLVVETTTDNLAATSLGVVTETTATERTTTLGVKTESSTKTVQITGPSVAPILSEAPTTFRTFSETAFTTTSSGRLIEMI